MIKITSTVFVEAEGIWVVEATVELDDGVRTQAYFIEGDAKSSDSDFIKYIKAVWNIV